jgi:hypothetical protein
MCSVPKKKLGSNEVLEQQARFRFLCSGSNKSTVFEIPTSTWHSFPPVVPNLHTTLSDPSHRGDRLTSLKLLQQQICLHAFTFQRKEAALE